MVSAHGPLHDIGGLDAHWRALIKRSTSLQRGVFSITGPRLQDQAQYNEAQGIVALPNLRELVFLDRSPFSGRTLMTGLTLPGLVKLRFFLSGDHKADWDVAKAPMPSPSLTHLTITQSLRGSSTGLSSGLRGTYINRVISTLPGLQELFVTVTRELDILFDALTLRPTQMHSLPQLEALGVHLSTEQYKAAPPRRQAQASTFPIVEIARAVASRTQEVHNGRVTGAARLQSLVVHFDDQQWVNGLIQSLRNTLSLYMAPAYGFTAGVFGVRDRTSKLGGRMPEEKGIWKHWDNGFMEFIEGVDEYNLDPTVPTPPSR